MRKKIYKWIKSNPFVIAFLASLLLAIVIDIWGGVGRIIETLYKIFLTIKIKPFYALEITSIFLSVMFFVLAIKERWENIKKMKEEQHLKSELEKKIQLFADPEAKVYKMGQGTDSPYFQIEIRQRLGNVSEFHLKISKIDVSLEVGGREVDNITRPEKITIYPGSIDDIPPLECDCLIGFESKKIDDYKNKNILIRVTGKIWFSVKTVEVIKEIEKEVWIDSEDWE